MNRAAIQRSINAVFIPERITQPDCHIVGAVLINGELIGGRAVLSQGHKGLGNRNNAGIAVRLGIVVNKDFSELCLLLLGIETLKEYKKALIFEYVTGKKRVKEE